MGKHSRSSSTLPSRPSRRWATAARGLLATATLVTMAAAGAAAVTDSASGGTNAAYAETINVTDTMNRTVSNGFGTADLGGSYTTAPTKTFSVTPGAGHVGPLARGSSATATLAPANRLDEQLQSTFNLPKLPASGGGVTYGLDLRRQSNGDRYGVAVRVGPQGTLTLTLVRVRSGTATALHPPTTVPSVARAGGRVVLEGYVAGSSPVTLQARAWLAGAPAPAWQLSASDSSSTPITAAGQVGLSMAVASDTASTRVTVNGLLGWALTPPTASSSPSAASTSPAPTTTSTSAAAPATSSAAPSTSSSAPIATASSTPSPTPTASSTIPAHPVPASIPSDCSTDVTGALTSFVNGVPDNSTVTFAPGGCYLVQETLEFRSRNGLTFEGNGATIKATTTGDDTRSHMRFLYGSNLTIRNLTIVGADSGGGTSSAYVSSLQHQAGIDLRGVQGALISNVTIRQVYGDCIYVGVGYDNTTWTTNVYAHDNNCARNGRSGMSVTAGRNVVFDHNTVSQPGLWGVDIEPNGGATGAVDVTVSNSTFTPGGHLEPFVQAVGNSGGGLVDRIDITGNTVKGMTLTTQFVPAAGQRWTNFTFSNNTSDTPGYLIYNQDCGCVAVVGVRDIDGITVQGNYQPGPGTDETFLYAEESCSVVQSGNQFPGGGTMANVAPYTCT